ncbi:hypothetical protein [Novosphingobium album (ex Liu et al. 2023)]|uniref:Uncharacterized protein n=1 Tax=Novosphingobium album (ex Liu et al. 2023) TaxID=3031130 RepID=A0ABT5WNG3_9SPHN|nr:hypothetical protein [Novosphingobium album (ex Liu et al. 2023)]MDE8651592.1 hypothetical protein [Novosphingobium album (ex Liu et al. 2023)]
MNFAAALLTPLMLLLPAAGTVEANREVVAEAGVATPTDFDPGTAIAANAFPDRPDVQAAPAWALDPVSQGFRPDSAWQVRIEQRMTIRITPRAPMPTRPDMLFNLPDREIGPHFSERKIGKCLPAAGITGVQPNGGNRLLLFMRDQRIVSAELERACKSRDFYSGFLLARTGDGQLCVNRDTLLSRNGANCKLSRIRQLVEVGD